MTAYLFMTITLWTSVIDKISGSFHRMWRSFMLVILLLLTLCQSNFSRVHASLQQPVAWSKKPVSITWTGAKECSLEMAIDIAPGWKVYAAEKKQAAGLPTKASWTQSSNIHHVQIDWPKPEVFPAKPDQTSVEGYKQRISLPITVWLDQQHTGVLRLKIMGLACSDLCAPFALEQTVTLTPSASLWSTWSMMALFAFLGGAILNIMPCVLPVLALKLKGLIGPDPQRIRQSFRWTIGGIFLGFWILAGMTIFIKYVFQQHIGWGMHLRNPYFLAIMMTILMIAGCGLLGLFHIQTPAWAYRFMGHGQAPRSSERTALLSGLLAVWLATPCSAPFLGSAVGFALTGRWWEMLLMFTCMAGGFALPYAVGLVAPVWRWLPKPGLWMERTERIMGGALMLSAGWFLWFGYRGLIKAPWHNWAAVLWGLWMIYPWALWTWRQRRWYNTLIYILPLVIGALWLVFPALDGTEHYRVSMREGNIQWKTWTEEGMKQALAAGNTVVVDITGLACPLCMMNKRVFLNPNVQQRMTQANVVCFRGDFSRANPKILDYLIRHGRVAIPFNVILGPSAPKGIVLSERLTADELIDVLTKASGEEKAKETMPTAPQPKSAVGEEPQSGRDSTGVPGKP